MGSTPGSGRPRGPGGPGGKLRNFWQRVSEGLELQTLWAQFSAEARSSYSLYVREVDWGAETGEKPVHRFFRIARALFWAMLMKLSPARRVFLLIALTLGLIALLQSRIVRVGQNQVVTGPDSGLWILLSIGALVFLLALELADRVTMKRDLEIAREIQHWLVPQAPPQVPGADIAFTSRPANTVGGDYYDAFLLDDGQQPSRRLLMVVADVAGKSVPASLLMATFQASLRSLATFSPSLSDLVSGMNRYACEHSLNGQRFTTAFFAELNTQTREVTYISAGHNPPLVRRASGQLEHLEAGSLPLGIRASLDYQPGQTTLAAGDLLVIFTDGLVETLNSAQEEFGDARLEAFLRSTTAPDAQRTLNALVATVDAFAGETRQFDDLTCLMLRAS